MSEKVTKGQWKVVLPDARKGLRRRVRVNTERGSIDCYKSGCDFDADVANAHLIAAAPELYAALKALTDDSRFSLAIGGNPNAINALVKQVDDALAKAEGRA